MSDVRCQVPPPRLTLDASVWQAGSSPSVEVTHKRARSIKTASAELSFKGSSGRAPTASLCYLVPVPASEDPQCTM